MNVKEDYMMPGQITIEQILNPDTWSGRMLQEPSAPTKEKISEPSLKKPQKLQTKMPLFLDLREENGHTPDVSFQTDGRSLGAYMMHNIGEFHKDENAYVYWLISTETPQERYCLNCSEKPLKEIQSKLSWILEQNPDPKYNLSAKACQGILRRAEKRGKELPKILKEALERASTIAFEPGATSRVGGHVYEDDKAGTVRANAGDNQQAVVYGICSYDSNAMKSDNPHSGIYEADTSRTLDLNGGNPSCNQGGMAVVCIEGNGQRESHKGDGYKESDTMYTLNTVEQHAVCIENNARKSLNSGNVVRCESVVRRLTPLECERLQGFPDFWTSIGDWVDSKGKTHKGDSDSPRYKALGNSIALPFWQWMAERMMPYLPENPTMASLFDGIGGFPLVFSRCGCKPVWASEIEEFPIAVTKVRFPE